MEFIEPYWVGIVIVFLIGYLIIVFEHHAKINKTAIALLTAVICWVIYFIGSTTSYDENIGQLGHHLSEVAQIVFFLIGAMTLVELIDSHQGFKVITDKMHSQSKRKMLWMIAFVSFFLSSVLDNLTTTILMVSFVRKLVEDRADRLILGCVIVIAANSGGAWTPIGDVTTTMLWINGQLSSLAVMKALFIPSMVSMLIPLIYFTLITKGKHSPISKKYLSTKVEPGAGLILVLGLTGLVCVPLFKALTGLPPFMGVIFALGALWLVTDLMHHKYSERQHLRVPHVLTRVDISGVLFFLGILLCVDALQSAGILKVVANSLFAAFPSQTMIANILGLFSAVIDNVPLVAATIGMYPLEQFPQDSTFWHMIAYAAGTGGSILIIGSAAGVALMGLEKVDFISYLRKATLPAFLGYIIGMGAYLLLS